MEEKFELINIVNYGKKACIKDIGKTIDLESDIDEIYCSPEFVDWLSKVYPAALRYVPTDKIPLSTRKSVYEKMDDIYYKKSFIAAGKMDEILDLQMAKELCKVYSMHDYYFYKKLKELDIMDQDMANIIYFHSVRNIEYIPERFITMEMVNGALQLDGRIIAVLPSKFQTTEIHKMVLNKSYKNLSAIPEEFLTDEVIKYALGLNGDALNYTPKARRTPEFCKLALAGNASCFRAIPDELKTHDICLSVLLKKPKSIRYVPVHMITEEFMKEIYDLNIIIPEDLLGYANECIKKNNQMKNAVIGENGKIEIPRIKLPENISNITINSLEMYFSQGALKWFEKLGINTFEDLVNFINQPDTIVNFKNKDIRDEIFGTTSLLKCKYLNEEPGIDITDEENTFDTINNRVGLSTRAFRGLKKIGLGFDTIKDFFEKVSTTDFSKDLSRLTNVGPKTIREIELKLGIITEFYSRKKINDSAALEIIDSNVADSTETLESLNNKLMRLRAQSAAIDAQIDTVLAKIQEKMITESKGGMKR